MGEYPPQSVLPTETRLANDYGVSRTVVRSALEFLKQDGVVVSRQGSGTVVADCDPPKIARLNREAQLPELKDCYVCRMAVEPEIAALVADNLSNSAIEFLEDQRQTLSSEVDESEYERSVHDAFFHVQLAEFSQNSFFINIMKQLRPHMLFAMNITKTLTKCVHEAHINLSRIEHLKIVEAILVRDSEAARTAMRIHLDKGAKRIFQN